MRIEREDLNGVSVRVSDNYLTTLSISNKSRLKIEQ